LYSPYICPYALDLPPIKVTPYLVHMTLIYGQQAEGLERAKQMIGTMDFGPGFQAKAVHLMGRVGPRVGGVWQLIESFPLGG
jgi:hypothetical protein